MINISRHPSSGEHPIRTYGKPLDSSSEETDSAIHAATPPMSSAAARAWCSARWRAHRYTTYRLHWCLGRLSDVTRLHVRFGLPRSSPMASLTYSHTEWSGQQTPADRLGWRVTPVSPPVIERAAATRPPRLTKLPRTARAACDKGQGHLLSLPVPPLRPPSALT